jgi:hypothetical protein
LAIFPREKGKRIYALAANVISMKQKKKKNKNKGLGKDEQSSE